MDYWSYYLKYHQIISLCLAWCSIALYPIKMYFIYEYMAIFSKGVFVVKESTGDSMMGWILLLPLKLKCFTGSWMRNDGVDSNSRTEAYKLCKLCAQIQNLLWIKHPKWKVFKDAWGKKVMKKKLYISPCIPTSFFFNQNTCILISYSYKFRNILL